MYKSEFNFDINAMFSEAPEYGATYFATNEDLACELQMAPAAGRRVLTVAASGDQPLMYAGHNAAHIDTFDISFHSHVIMDFKTAALRMLDFQEYSRQIHYMHRLDPTERANLFRRAKELMPRTTAHLLGRYDRNNFDYIFSNNMNVASYYMPNDAETYAAAQRNVTRPFNFIWASLYNLHNFLDMEYDIMNLSNIFTWCKLVYHDSDAKIQEALRNLWPHLTTGGKIIVCNTASALPTKWFDGLKNISTIEDGISGRWRISAITKIR